MEIVTGNLFAEVAAQEPAPLPLTLPSTPLSGHGHSLLQEPGRDRLNGTAHCHDLLVLRAVLGLEGPSVFHVVQSCGSR